MPRIHILDQSLINKIAAGEVIERPASIVKELLENALDAGATSLDIDVKESGVSFIQVADNGSGMDREDAELCITRHSTSKIAKAEDLFNIHTLGFRGEALASISSVSRTAIRTRTKDAVKGTEVATQAGKILSVKPIGVKQGTTVIVEDLFFNTPARRKHMKDMETEFRQILDVVMRYALANPEVHFTLKHNSKEVLNCPATSNTLNNITSLYGRDVAKNLLPVNYSQDSIQVMGFISKPSYTRSDRSYQSLFVNSRSVQNKTISQAIYDAFHTLLFINRHPVALLNITIPANMIDVNVHPTKKEIRLEKEKLVYEVVFNAISETLQKHHIIPKISAAEIKNYDFRPTKSFIREKAKTDYATQQTLKAEGQKSSAGVAKTVQGEKDARFPPLKILDVIDNTYIIAKSKDSLYVIDQHAAEERVNYEKFMQQYKHKGIAVQKLLEPLVFDLDRKKSSLLKQNLPLLGQLGFKVEEFGDTTFRLITVPLLFQRLKDITLFNDLIDELEASEKATKLGEQKEARIIRFACRASIKAGDELPFEYLYNMLKDLSRCEKPFSCPHGRPTLIELDVKELEKKFQRV